jgi:hypothetical protein
LELKAGVGVVATISAEAVAEDEDGFSFAVCDRWGDPGVHAFDGLPSCVFGGLIGLGSGHVDEPVGKLVAHAEVESNPEGEQENHFT